MLMNWTFCNTTIGFSTITYNEMIVLKCVKLFYLFNLFPEKNAISHPNLHY